MVSSSSLSSWLRADNNSTAESRKTPQDLLVLCAWWWQESREKQQIRQKMWINDKLFFSEAVKKWPVCGFWQQALQRRVAAAEVCRERRQQGGCSGRTFCPVTAASFWRSSSLRGGGWPAVTRAAPALAEVVCCLAEKVKTLRGSEGRWAYSGEWKNRSAALWLWPEGLPARRSEAALCSWWGEAHRQWRSLHYPRCNRPHPQSQIWGIWQCDGATSGCLQSSGCDCGAEGSAPPRRCSYDQLCDAPGGCWTSASTGGRTGPDGVAASPIKPIFPGWIHTAIKTF